MDSSLRSLITDPVQYSEAFFMYLNRSTEHECMQRFIDTKLSDIISRIGSGKSPINVLSLGSGTGEMDMHILSKLRNMYPGALINNESVEPSEEHILLYKDNVSKTQNIDNVTFSWHKKDTSEYETEIKQRKEIKQFDFIHMIQMIYYVKDVPATIKFFRSCLAPNGKLLIVVLSEKSGWIRFYDACSSHLSKSELPINICSGDITQILDSQGIQYESYNIQSYLDVTECFIEGNRNGQLLLDMLTETCNFNGTATDNQKMFVMEQLRSPDYSFEENGKILLSTDLTALIINAENHIY
ncbi:histamine N-methyltransferase-like [Bombina bombina]|uniref:histamine N-methyltransferase-like n=1 Tax=Bombina bombina TaxID=8345 RepID=UPI00235AD299|nr:histamine N-methyltransferase-like [Bombina bombina]